MTRRSLAWLALSTGCAMARPPTASAPPAAQAQGASMQGPGATQGALPWQTPSPREPSSDGASMSPAPTAMPVEVQPSRGHPLGGAPVAPTTTPPPAPPAPPRPSRVGGPQDASPPEAERPEAALAWHEAQLRAAVARLSADAATCRDLCGASATICRAAGEICRLTQDAERTAPRDPRCRNARVACEDAGRRRDGACPTCPDAR